MQANSITNLRIFHSDHLPLNGGYSSFVFSQARSIIGYGYPARFWPAKGSPSSLRSTSYRPTWCSAISRGKGNKRNGRQKKPKENVWSIDNELAERAANKVKVSSKNLNKKKKGGGGVSKSGRNKTEFTASRAIVSAAIPVETEEVLQTQEPVIIPIWDTFASSISGFWQGVGGVFSPLTGEMEPISLGKINEYLYDCYTLSKVGVVGYPSQQSDKKIHRKINWVVANPLGEQGQGELTIQDGLIKAEEDMSEPLDHAMDANGTPTQVNQEKTVPNSLKEKQDLPIYETKVSFSSNVMEEDLMDLEPGLVFFEDGSYSRGPLMLRVGGSEDDSSYYLSPTYKIEQCLVRGHKRLRLVHTIALKEGGSEVQLMRLAVYKEEWIGPGHLEYMSDIGETPLEPISQQQRISPSDLVGTWKVFEISATAMVEDLEENTPEKRPSFVYLCMETLKKRILPEVAGHFADEDALDMQDVTVLWLPGQITAFVETKEDGVLSIGIGWYSDDGTNLVMERDYGADGKLLEVRTKTEVKRRWSFD